MRPCSKLSVRGKIFAELAPRALFELVRYLLETEMIRPADDGFGFDRMRLARATMAPTAPAAAPAAGGPQPGERPGAEDQVRYNEVIEIIEAGDIFAYARKTGMIPG